MAPDHQASDEVQALDRAIEALEQQRDVLGEEVVATALRPLKEKRARLLSQPGERRKLVTVLFSDLVDSTPLTAALGAEAMREVMRRYFERWRTGIEAEGGVVEKFIGDAVVGVFGMARSREDDPHRAVRAALAVQESLSRLADDVRREHGVELRTRVGIDTGEVVLGSLGERGDGDIVVVGESMNRAARLQNAAPVDGILLSAATARHVRGAFGLQRVGELDLKGIDGPVTAFLVHGPAELDFWVSARGVEGVRTRTVGRDVELQQLRKLFADAAAERCATVVTVFGEAGIGKSRLLAELERWLAALPEQVWVLRGRADAAGETVPNSLLRSAFADRLGILSDDDPVAVREKWRTGLASLPATESSPGLPVAVSSGAEADAIAAWLGFAVGDLPELGAWRQDPQGLARRARRALDDLLRRMSGQAPVVLLLEDLHWADATSLDWLQDLQATAPPYPLLVVATARPALLERRPHWGEGLRGHQSVRLQPLSRRESLELVGEVLQRLPDAPEWLRTLVVEEGEGNPFFIEELVAWLVDRGTIRTGPDTWSVAEEATGRAAVPHTLRGVLEARLDALEPDERDLTDRAAVIGRVFWDRAVEHLTDAGQSDKQDTYHRLRAREVVQRRPTSTFEHASEFTFRHALLRDVAYDGLLGPRRRHYHARAAEWLEQAVETSGRADEHAVTVAHHLVAAGQDRLAAEWFLRAGRHAAASYANEEALQLLERALGAVAADDSGHEFEVLAEQERVLDRLGRREAQRAVLDRLAAAAGADPARRARALTAAGRLLFYQARYVEAATAAEQSAALAREAGRTDLELEALLLGGRSLAFHSDHAAARRHLETVVVRATEQGSRHQLAEAQRLLGVVATNLHEEREAIQRLEQAAELFREAADLEGEGLTISQLGAVLLLTGRLEEAWEKCQEGLAIFVATGHRLRQGIVLGNLVSIATEQGRLDEAMRLGRTTLELSESVEDAEGVASSLQRLGDLERMVGRVDEARQHLQRSAEVGSEHDLHYFVAFAWFALATLDLAEGSLEDAAREAEWAVSAAERSQVPAVLARSAFVDGLVAHARGDRHTAAERLREAVSRHTQVGMEREALECNAVLAAALLNVGEVAAATQVARQVSAGLSEAAPELPGWMEPGLTLVECHRVLAAAGDPDAATIAEAAQRYLQQRAAAIEDRELRDAFLGTAPNRRLAALQTDHPAAGRRAPEQNRSLAPH